MGIDDVLLNHEGIPHAWLHNSTCRHVMAKVRRDVAVNVDALARQGNIVRTASHLQNAHMKDISNDTEKKTDIHTVSDTIHRRRRKKKKKGILCWWWCQHFRFIGH